MKLKYFYLGVGKSVSGHRFWYVGGLCFTGTTETTTTTLGFGGEFLNNTQRYLYNRLEHQLCDPVTRLYGVRVFAIVCQDDAYFAMVVRINDTNTLSYANTMFQ
ncbi:hypothetical protein WP7W18E02_00710 [Aeromonas media]|nr:hypothetical protein WP7W18E02_00710 [Aeromonas media]